MKKDLINIIQSNNLKITKLITEVIMVLENSTHPLSIEDFLHELSKKDIHPNKTTLYRQMEKLKNIGIIQESLFSDSIRRYCLDSQHHHHFHCNQCGYTEKLPEKICSQINNALTSKNFKISKHIFEVEGTCNKCN